MNAATENTLPHRHRLTVHDYHRMAEVGLLKPEARVELIDGEIIDMAPIGVLHGGTTDYLAQALMRAVGDRALVRVQGAIRLDEFSEPQPDFALLKPRDDFYSRGHPGPADTLLIIEVSDTTLRFDRGTKLPLYARHGVPEVWIVDLKNKRLNLFRNPAEGQYTESSSTDKPGIVAIAVLPEVMIDLSRLAMLWS